MPGLNKCFNQLSSIHITDGRDNDNLLLLYGFFMCQNASGMASELGLSL